MSKYANSTGKSLATLSRGFIKSLHSCQTFTFNLSYLLCIHYRNSQNLAHKVKEEKTTSVQMKLLFAIAIEIWVSGCGLGTQSVYLHYVIT